MSIKNYSSFLRWALLASSLGVVSVVLGAMGLFSRLNEGDITKITFLIYIAFVLFSARVGVLTWRYCSGRDDNAACSQKAEMSWFASREFLTAGMIGTVLGFIYLLSAFFQGIDPDKAESMSLALGYMSGGMCTALYTTAMGLICSLLLKIQLFNLEYCMSTEGKCDETEII
jgi:hypothetical protein